MRVGAHSYRRPGVRDRRFERSGRAAFASLLGTFTPGASRRILLPAYVGWSPKEGSGLHDPILAAGLRAAFYPLDARLCCRCDAFVQILNEVRPIACVVIHYFGFPEPALTFIAERCRALGVPLIEDCAHCTPGGGVADPIGRLGDFVLHSIHKILPTSGGGLLSAGSGVFEGAQACLSAIPSEPIEPKALECFATAAWTQIRAQRRRNYLRLAEQIDRFSGVSLLHPELPADVAPLNLPLRLLKGGPDRHAVYQALRRRGIEAVALYHTLIEPLASGAFPDAQRSASQILNLPCHQDLGPEAMDAIIAAWPESMEEAERIGVLADPQKGPS